jgi:UDP-GlcNAc:undecaprenyl-phosphate/decaprenyl-phosphate GlcNAc-1-phosphate transferase
MKMALCFITAVILTYFMTFPFRCLAFKWKILDHPDARKIHSEPMPLLGGLSICLTVIIACVLKPFIIGNALPIIIGGVAYCLINILDDRKGLPAKLRFGLESVIALAVILSGIRLSFLPAGFWGDLGEILLTLIWFVGVTNAFNYQDGMDGLAVGSASINFFCFGLVLHWSHQDNLSFLSFILLGSCLGFLPHNFPRARIFLGDAGSTFLGFMLAGISVVGNWGENDLVKICVPILFLGVPIFDMIFTTILRVQEGKVKTIVEWLKYGGKDHFHHYLTYLGFHATGTVIFIWTIILSLGLSGIMLFNNTAADALLTLCQAAIVFGVIGVLIVVGKRHKAENIQIVDT